MIGKPAARTRSTPAALLREDITLVIRAFSLPAAMYSCRLSSVRPLPDISTARRTGAGWCSAMCENCRLKIVHCRIADAVAVHSREVLGKLVIDLRGRIAYSHCH